MDAPSDIDKTSYLLSLKGDGIGIEKKISQQQALQIIQITMSSNHVVFGTKKGAAFVGQHGMEAANNILPNETIGEFIERIAAKRKPDQITSIAYYVKHSEEVQEFTRDDIKARFKPAGLGIPKNIHRDFGLAVKERWIAEDHQNPGSFFITSTGETAVNAGFTQEKKKRGISLKSKRDQNSKKGRAPTGRSSAQILKNLNLNAADGVPSLDEFFRGYSTTVDLERNVVFAHYLSEVKGINPVTQDHIFTCYHHLGFPLPVSMTSSLKNSNATSRGGYLMSSNPHDVKLSTQGLNLIHRLKNKKKAA